MNIPIHNDLKTPHEPQTVSMLIVDSIKTLYTQHLTKTLEKKSYCVEFNNIRKEIQDYRRRK